MLTLPQTAAAFLSGLEQHRQLTTLQLRDIYAPDRSLQWARRNLRLLLKRRLAGYSDIGSAHHRCWHLTRLGAEVVGGNVKKVLSAEKAAGPLQAHTLAVNAAGLAFLEAARVRGHGFEPEDWRHEVAHKLPERGFLIADAVLDYRIGASLVLSFLELDNGTEQVRRLVEQLEDYVTYYRSKGWKERYGRAGASILVILAGKPRPQLEQRLRTLVALAHDPRLQGVSFSFALLDDLKRRGPWEPIFRRPHLEGTVNWRGESSGLKVVSTY